MKKLQTNEQFVNGRNDIPYRPEDYLPEKVPAIVELAAKNKNNNREVLVRKVNDICSIVDREEISVVGIKTVLTSESCRGFLQMAEKYIMNGTVGILESMLPNKNPGQYIGISADISGGGNFTYIVGIEVDSFESLPEALPENTVAYRCPGGRFAKIKKSKESDKYDLWDYFTQGFREETEYVYDKNLLPYQVLGENADVLYAYEPVKIPINEDEKYDTVSWKTVMLPQMKFAGIKSVTKHGIDVIYQFFNEFEEAVNRLPSRQWYVQDYIGFALFEKGIMYSCFGAQVEDFKNLPEGIDTLTLTGGLYVHFTQLEINNDDPAGLYKAVNKVFFEKNPAYTRDSERCDIIRFHQGHSASIYIPISKEV